MSIALWWQSGLKAAGPKPASKADSKNSTKLGKESKTTTEIDETPSESSPPAERRMFFPLIMLTAIHFSGLIPLSLFNHTSPSSLATTFQLFTVLTLPLPIILAVVLPHLLTRKVTQQELTLLHCFCLLLLGLFLSALATINYSLSYVVGALCSPLVLIRLPNSIPLDAVDNTTKSQISTQKAKGRSIPKLVHTSLLTVILWATSPMTVIWVSSTFVPGGLSEVLRVASFGWWVWGLWTQVVVWLVWWPAWLSGCFVLASQGL